MRVAKTAATTPEPDEFVDSEVPAAVVCAHCGEAECTGCPQDRTQSGIVSVIAWERPGVPAFARLWATARATPFDAERFFESIPDGPVLPALRFALLSELIASAAMALLALVALAIAAPAWAYGERAMIARLFAAGVPGVAVLLVMAHAAHGWALDFGARGLRVGLYASGWDLVLGPVGGLVVAAKDGLGVSMSIVGIGMGLPGRSARAFLRGCYHLDGDAAGPALRASYAAAAIATTIGAIAVVAAIAWMVLF